MSCGCKNKVNSYVDVSRQDAIPWNDVPALLGLTMCGDVVVVDKPLYELSEEDRKKLDMLIRDGKGDLFLSDDGTYKVLEVDPRYVTLEYNSNPSNFVINNMDKLRVIWDQLQKGYEQFVHLHIAPYYIPVTVAIGTRSMIIEHDMPLITVNGDEVTYRRQKILIGLRTDVDPFNVIFYEVRETVDSNEVINVGGDGDQALYDDGQYKPTYTKLQVDTLLDGLNDLINEGSEAVDALGLRIMSLEETTADLDTLVTQNATSISDLQETTDEAFGVVNDAINGLSDRVTVNESNIAANTSDIEQIREDITNQEKFRGYFETTDEITALPNPTPGDYAWNVETGTVWTYNGTTWYNTTVPIPDQSVDAYDAVPRMDGAGDAGTTNRYSRGDHQHPHDDTKADITALNNYLPLAGNSQTTRITGPVWLSTGQRVNLTNSGNSYIGQDSITNTTQVAGNGVGGVDIIAGNGTVKANGQEVVTYDSNDDIRAKRDIYLGNDNNIFGIGADGAVHNLIEKNRFGIIDAGSQQVPFNISSSIRPTVQLQGESGSQAHDIAFVSDVQTAQTTLQVAINENAAAIDANSNDIEANASDIESILSRLADEENFRGYKLTTNDVTSIENPQNGNYAYNVQTGTIWVYNGTTWADSLEPVPDGSVQASNLVPLMDGTAETGTSNEYSRGDHRHPSDASKADASELTSTNNNLQSLSDNYFQFVDTTESVLETLNSNIYTNTGNIAALKARVGTAESDITSLQSRATEIGQTVTYQSTAISDLDVRTTQNENDIESLQSAITNAENFRGYYRTTIEITTLPNSTPGDYAWNAETGTVWIYDGSVPSWTDSTNPIPSGAVSPSDTLPLQDGEANAGESTSYSRGDHVHPSDPTKAGIEDLENYLPLSGGNLTGPLTTRSVLPREAGIDNIGADRNWFGVVYSAKFWDASNSWDLGATVFEHEQQIGSLDSRVTALENNQGLAYVQVPPDKAAKVILTPDGRITIINYNTVKVDGVFTAISGSLQNQTSVVLEVSDSVSGDVISYIRPSEIWWYDIDLRDNPLSFRKYPGEESEKWAICTVRNGNDTDSASLTFVYIPPVNNQ